MASRVVMAKKQDGPRWRLLIDRSLALVLVHTAVHLLVSVGMYTIEITLAGHCHNAHLQYLYKYT